VIERMKALAAQYPRFAMHSKNPARVPRSSMTGQPRWFDHPSDCAILELAGLR
jgi:hypothetical protein